MTAKESDETERASVVNEFSPGEGDRPDYRLKDTDKPYQDEGLMREMYVEGQMNMKAMAEEFQCSPTTVRKWLGKLGIDQRPLSETLKLAKGPRPGVCFKTSRHGYMVWQDSTGSSSVHRLLAVAEWGFDAMRDKHVHHINGIPWDNRVENLKIVSNSEHQREHTKVSGVERIRVAELYEHGDISIRDLGEMFDVSGTTVFNIHKEFYGDD